MGGEIDSLGAVGIKIVPPEKLDESSREMLSEFEQKNPQDDIRPDWR